MVLPVHPGPGPAPSPDDNARLTAILIKTCGRSTDERGMKTALVGASPASGGLPAQAPMNMADLVEALPDCVLLIDMLGVIRYTNCSAERQLGYRFGDWFGRSLLDLVHPDDIPSVLSSIEAVQGKPVGTPVEVRVRDVYGAWHWYEEIGTNVVLDDGTAGILCVARNITQRRMWEVAGSDVARFQQVVEVAPAITLLLDESGAVTSVNAAFTRMLGHDHTNVVGRRFISFVAAGHEQAVQQALDELIRDGGSIAFESRMTVVGQQDVTRLVRFEMVSHLADPVVAGIVVSGHDVTEHALVREELEYLARHDALTGLTTRAHLVTHVEEELLAGRPFAVLFIDLDRFKPVNDLWGHETGDEILRMVGDRLEHSVRPSDLVARVGGDEFVVVAHGVRDWSSAKVLADRVEASIALPYNVDVGPIRIGASVGICISDDASTVASVLADADLAMYDAKSQRRGTFVRSAIERKRSATDRRQLADEFMVGLTRGEIVAHLQPIVEARGSRLTGMEALARWNHPRLGLLRPATFIDLVTDAGLDLQLGDAVLQSACVAMEQLALNGFHPDLAINLSVGQLADPGLAVRISRKISQYGLAPRRLVVEITELAILAPLAAVGGASADQTLRSMHDLGATLSLDDFGTGYSSLSHVRRFPLGAIKIDQTFVAGVCVNSQDRAVVEVVVGLGHALGLLVVAEGVETAQQLEALAEIGCDQVQGHFIAHPMAADTAVEWAIEQA